MKKKNDYRYQLQVVLIDGKVRDIPIFSDQLAEIDQKTAKFNSTEFQAIVQTKEWVKKNEVIDKFQIAVKGKPNPYSVAFNNPYLIPVLDSLVTDDYGRHYKIESNHETLHQMMTFLEDQLETQSSNFLKQYRYQNTLSRKINQYLQSTNDDSLEELNQRNFLKSQIMNEISHYKTYRSLCIYRAWYDAKQKNPLLADFSLNNGNTQTKKPKTQIKRFEVNQELFDQRYSLSPFSNGLYLPANQTMIENLAGEVVLSDDDDKEEFLSQSELEKMRR